MNRSLFFAPAGGIRRGALSFAPITAALTLLLTLVAAALQFWDLGAQSLWYDEGFSVWLAQQQPAAIIELTAADIQPPLYYLLLHGWISLTGTSEYALRFFSAACAVVTVPLMAQVARRLLQSPSAGVLAASLVAVSPLWLWYGREVRNYAFLLVLVLAAAYGFAALLTASRPRWRTAALVAVLLTFALYSHYFVLFVLAAWAVPALISAWQARRVRTVPLLIALGVPFLLYSPWLSIMLTRLGADRSYWEGRLNVADALNKTVASWMVGHTMPEAVGLWAGWVGVGVAAVGAWRMVRQATGDRRQVTGDRRQATGDKGGVRAVFAPCTLRLALFLLAWLILPLLGYLWVALERPKFNARYLIFAVPPFLMLVAAAVEGVWRQGLAGRGLAAVMVAGLVGLFGVADWNLYTNALYAKADWRGVAQMIAAQRGEDEAIVLVSGHAFPMLDYYLAGHDAVLLPPERTLDATAVVGPEVAAEVAAAVNGKRGVWLINWQDEVVDPEGIVPTIFEMGAGEQEVIPAFQEVRLSHWTWAQGAQLPTLLTYQQAQQVRFGGALQLKGWSALPQASPADSGLEIVLFWQAQQPLSADYKVRVRVVDAQGFELGVADQRLTAYNLPTFRWEAGATRVSHLTIPLLAGTARGDYWVEVSVYSEDGGTLDILDEANNPQGQRARLGPLAVAAATEGWRNAALPPNAQILNGDLGQGITLVATQGEIPATVEQGRRYPLYLWVRRDGEGDRGAMLDLGWWQADVGAMLEVAPFALPDTIGEMMLVPVLVQVPQRYVVGTARLSSDLTVGGPAVTLATVDIIESTRTFDPPTPITIQEATFGEQIKLVGYTLLQRSATEWQVTLDWLALQDGTESLTTFVHVLDANGVLIPNAGQDKIPQDGARPTDTWLAGEFISDSFTLTLPTDTTAPPPYAIEVGWYDASNPSLPRLPAVGEGAEGTRVLLRGAELE